ncbi:hypothetical protein RJ55_02772 [Drechmeria coniospora]|nr:hypothetical protein RJ55_02772 [Drechmeria coniospora]
MASQSVAKASHAAFGLLIATEVCDGLHWRRNHGGRGPPDDVGEALPDSTARRHRRRTSRASHVIQRDDACSRRTRYLCMASSHAPEGPKGRHKDNGCETWRTNAQEHYLLAQYKYKVQVQGTIDHSTEYYTEFYTELYTEY